MLAIPFLGAVAAAAALALPCPSPQAGADLFITRSARGITLNYSMDMTPQDAEAFVQTIAIARDVLHQRLSIVLPNAPVVQLRQRKGARRCFYTDGEDRLFFDFPVPDNVKMLSYGDPRIMRHALPVLTQLWLYRSLSSTAGLDPRILDSLVDFAEYTLRVEQAMQVKNGPPAEQPTKGGQVWLQLESIYPGTLTFMMNSLSVQKVPGHLLGKALRDMSVEITEDKAVASIFDPICTVEPVLSPTELEPGPPVRPTSPLRPGRLALFNGAPLLDVQGDPISVADRLADFERVFDLAVVTLPQPERTITLNPPSLSGLQIWSLYFEFRPRVLKSSDNLDYYLVLREFLARFKDRALALRNTPALPVTPGSPLWISVPGLGFARRGDRIYVAKVVADSEAAKGGVTPGLEIATVDGRPASIVLDLLATFTEVFDSCPSRQRAEAFALDNLLLGARDTQCELVLRDSAAKDEASGTRTVRLARGYPPTPPAQPATVESELRASDHVGVIRINLFGDDALPRFGASMTEMVQKGAKALVIDVRGNEGGRDPRSTDPISLAILSQLLPPDAGKLVVAGVAHRHASEFEKVELNEIVVAPTPGAITFAGPIAVLTDAWTGGDAELFVLGFQLAKRGLVMGATTGGSVTLPMNADPIQSLTRSRLELSCSMNTLVRPDGKPLQGIGITPQRSIEVEPADLQKGRDTVLETAALAIVPKQ